MSTEKACSMTICGVDVLVPTGNSMSNNLALLIEYFANSSISQLYKWRPEPKNSYSRI